jgi:hypothetical protein
VRSAREREWEFTVQLQAPLSPAVHEPVVPYCNTGSVGLRVKTGSTWHVDGACVILYLCVSHWCV